MRTIEENKALCKEMPYIAPHNLWTGKIIDDYDYSWIESDNLPNGWRKLFIQMCRDIKEPLEQADLMDTFYFTEVKEKYDTMQCYHNGAPQIVLDITDKYEYLSQFICQICGKPATKETRGWIASYCDDCLAEYEKGNTEDIEFDPIMHIVKYSNNSSEDIYIDCSDEWERLFKENKEEEKDA